MQVPPPRATRDVRVDWEKTLEAVLQPISGALPLSPTVKNTLAMLQSYAQAPLELFADEATGVADAKAYAALLLALDQVVTAWPHALQQRLSLPPVHMGAPRGAAYLRQYTVTRPRAEAVLVCYNAAVANVEVGLDSMDRVRAEAAAGGYGATRLSAATGTAAKTAHKAFQRAEQLLRLATDVLVAEAGLGAGTKRDATTAAVLQPLSVTDRQELQVLIDVATVRPLTRLCAASAKYLFSLSSTATSERPDLLARVAYDAACVEVPASCGALCVLPTLLLAAYHRHMAEYYCTSGRQKSGVPDMSHALGHARYADHLIREASETYAGPAPAASGLQVNLSRWRKALLTSVSSKLGAVARRGRSGGEEEDNDGEGRAGGSGSALLPVPPSPTAAELDTEDDDDRALRKAREATVSSYNRLIKAVDERGEADVLRIFPVLHRLLHQVDRLLRQYEHENRVVYFTTVASMDSVRDDIPSVSASATAAAVDDREDGEAEAARRAAAVQALTAQVAGRTTFADLPSAEVLEAEVARASETAKDADALAAAIDHLDGVLHTMEAHGLQPVSEVSAALEAVVPCFSQEGSVDAALDMAETAVQQAWDRQVQAEQLRRERKDAHLGAISPRDTATTALEARAKQWWAHLGAAREAWRRELQLPYGGPITSEDALMDCLIPTRSQAQAAIAAAQAVRDEASEVMAALMEGKAGSSRAATPLLRRVLDCAEHGEALVKSWTAGRTGHTAAAARLASQLQAIQAVVTTVWEAPRLVHALDDATAALADEAKRVGEVRPLDRIPDGAVTFATTPKAKKPVPKKATPAAPPTRKRTRAPTPSPSSSSSSSSSERDEDEDNGDDDVSSADLGTPQEAPYQEEPTEAKVSSAFLAKLKARKAAAASTAAEVKESTPPKKTPAKKAAAKKAPAKKATPKRAASAKSKKGTK